MDKNDSNNINYLFSQIDKTINAFREGASIDFSSVATYLHNDLCELGELLDQKNYKDLFKKCEAINNRKSEYRPVPAESGNQDQIPCQNYHQLHKSIKSRHLRFFESVK